MNIEGIKRAVGSTKPGPVRFEEMGEGLRLLSCWDGGSKDYWTFLDLKTGATAHVPENGHGFESDEMKRSGVVIQISGAEIPLKYDHGLELCDPKLIPDQVVLVESAVFMGKHMPITIWTKPGL